MARLVIKSDGVEKTLELKLGINFFGRTSDNDFQLEHPTISSRHCQIEVLEGEILIKDCGSTNGTFYDGMQVQEARVPAGGTFRIGDVELFVETTEVKVEIPRFVVAPTKAPPVVLTDGSLLCSRHPKSEATHQCTHCREILCVHCVTRLRRRGGKTLELCSVCSHKAEPLGKQKTKRKGFLTFLQRTIKMPMLGQKAPD